MEKQLYRCVSCHYWKTFLKSKNRHTVGSCYRFPPQHAGYPLFYSFFGDVRENEITTERGARKLVSEYEDFFTQPKTNAYDGCGEWTKNMRVELTIEGYKVSGWKRGKLFKSRRNKCQ